MSDRNEPKVRKFLGGARSALNVTHRTIIDHLALVSLSIMLKVSLSESIVKE
jgi:hypothetical protein